MGLLALTPRAHAALDPTILVQIEEPEANQVATGIRLVRGFAVSPDGVARAEWWIDDVYAGNLPFGGSRGDVGAAYPGFPGSSESGFAAAWNYSLFEPESVHTIRVRAVEPGGDYNEAEVVFSTRRFGDATFVTADEISLEAFSFNSIHVGGTPTYKVDLEWSNAAQQWVIRDTEFRGNLLVMVGTGPNDLNAVKNGDDADLTWTDNATGEFGWYVERRYVSPLVTGPWKRIAILPGSRDDFRDTNVNLDPTPLPGSHVDYRVQSFRESGTNQLSNVDSIARPILGALFPEGGLPRE